MICPRCADRGNDMAQIMELGVPSEMSWNCIVEWSPTITRHFRSQNLESRGGHEVFIETSHPPLSRMSIYRLGFPYHLQVLTPRRAGDALVHCTGRKTGRRPLPRRRPHPNIKYLHQMIQDIESEYYNSRLSPICFILRTSSIRLSTFFVGLSSSKIRPSTSYFRGVLR